MKTITSETMSVASCSSCTTVELFGMPGIPASIQGTIDFTFTREQNGGIGDRMENAIRGSEEVTIDSVDLTVTLNDTLTFKTTSIDFYEEHFGELEVEDVVGYV